MFSQLCLGGGGRTHSVFALLLVSQSWNVSWTKIREALRSTDTSWYYHWTWTILCLPSEVWDDSFQCTVMHGGQLPQQIFVPLHLGTKVLDICKYIQRISFRITSQTDKIPGIRFCCNQNHTQTPPCARRVAPLTNISQSSATKCYLMLILDLFSSVDSRWCDKTPRPLIHWDCSSDLLNSRRNTLCETKFTVSCSRTTRKRMFYSQRFAAVSIWPQRSWSLVPCTQDAEQDRSFWNTLLQI